MKVLYLGLRPPKGVYHYPVIRIIPHLTIEDPLKIWNQFTHILVTSQTTAELWPGPWDKKLIAIGEKTAKKLPKRALIPKEATQEGIAKLLDGINGFFFYPHSKRARPFLRQYMSEKKIPFYSSVLYDIAFQKLDPVPNLDNFDEIIFTSPSTVDGFLQIFGELPKNQKLVAIGPITKEKLKSSTKKSSKIIQLQP